LLAARLRDLVQTVLGLARDDAGGPAINWQALPIERSFERLAVALTPFAQMEDVELTFVTSTVTVESDPVMLDRILGNLVENAIRHSHGRRVLIGCRRRGNDVLIHVIDDGRGMKSTSPLAGGRSPGSGLSLGWGIVTDTAAALGHALEILPTTRGTNIALTVPRVEARANEAEVPSEAPALSGSVLIIDDDIEVRDALAMTLRLAGLSVSTAGDHASAMSRIAGLEQPPDFLIIDFNLPNGRYGTETYDVVTVVLGRVIPTIFVTGSTALADLAALRAYRWPVLLKPISSAQILEAAQVILTKSWNREPAH
jgi:CheY-like chemotaxis protein